MDLIQHYTSETESEPETQSEGDKDFPIKSDVSEGEDNERDHQTSIPPPLPNIEIYSQLYQQNMSKTVSVTFGYLPWKPPFAAIRNIERACLRTISKIPLLSNNYKFVSTHKDTSRLVKQHITVFPGVGLSTPDTRLVADKIFENIAKLEVPKSMIVNVGGGSDPLSQILNKQRKAIRFQTVDYLKLARGFTDDRLFLLIYVKHTADSIRYANELTNTCRRTLEDNGYLQNNGKIPSSSYHVSICTGYLKKAMLSQKDIAEVNKQLQNITIPELADFSFDVEEFCCTGSNKAIYSHRLLPYT
ncbi:conserved hypothetical protein [Candida dubliniensis CD36]|uniref:Uncharacterized protein n=1 Tax=Candida dubliniensis (strain CD36 / ATCC MYA-646 / CBS 7987 / NCPF 3949 / NRRL Y-17841) TaxID=573826 RepID=B9WML4_CANDC|nr:conserved hypothetical protein [Candida dubliniensis CD36]CAX40329.1 conserved hypothetical protein [Candida dubliniensis CD36]